MSETKIVASIDEMFSGPCKRRYKEIGPTPVGQQCFRIQSLTEGELSKHQSASIGKEGFIPSKAEQANRLLIAKCLVDQDGNRILADSQSAKLSQLDAADSTYLYDEISKHVGLKRDDIGDLAKNSSETAADCCCTE